MMDNVINFMPKRKKFSRYLFTLEMYMNDDGEMEVVMDIGQGVEDEEVFEALVGAGIKFATDNSLVELEPEDE